jgi:transposase InsO family protein
VVSSKLVGVNRICSILGISKATYYNAKDPKETFCKKYAYIRKYILKVIKKHPYYGIRRIKKALILDYGVFVGRDTLGKLLKIWGLSLARNVKKKRPSMIEKILRELSGRANILIRTRINSVFQAITSDITRLKYKDVYCYLCIHKDVLGQMVYGWSFSRRMDKEIVLQSLNIAFKTIRRYLGKVPKRLIVHQDQGSQYTSYKYIEVVLNFCRISFSKKGTPTENPGQESFFGRLKDEEFHEIADLNSIRQVENFVRKRIKKYNTDRLHTSIGYTTPINYTKLMLKKRKKRFSFFRT